MPETFHSHNTSVLRLISGNFAGLIAKIWGDQLHQFLMATDVRRHVWCGWLSGFEACRQVGDLLRFLTNSKSRDLVADRFGDCPPGYLPALKRMGTRAQSSATYQGLFDILANGGPLSKAIHHATKIDDDFIACVRAIPNDDFSSAIASQMRRNGVETDRLCGAVWLAGRLRSDYGADTIFDTLKHSSNPLNALHKLVLKMSFPNSPIDTEAPLSPLRSADEIKAIARQLRNCLRDNDCLSEAVLSIQSGQEYFYRWEGEETALVALKKFASLGWVIEEAYGYENRRLSEKTRRQIGIAFSMEPSLCGAFLTGMTVPSRGWFFK